MIVQIKTILVLVKFSIYLYIFLQVSVLQVRVLQIRVLQIRVLQVQSGPVQCSKYSTPFIWCLLFA